MNATKMKLANPASRCADEHEMPFAVLVIGGFDTDLIALLGILNDTDWTLYWNTSRADAVETLRRRPVNVVLCDRDLPDGNWEGRARSDVLPGQSAASNRDRSFRE